MYRHTLIDCDNEVRLNELCGYPVTLTRIYKYIYVIIVPIHKKGGIMDCNNYRGISLLSTSYKILSNILLSRMTPYANEIIVEYQCGFRRNRSTADHIFSIWQILEKKWEYNKEVCQLFIPGVLISFLRFFVVRKHIILKGNSFSHLCKILAIWFYTLCPSFR